MSILITGATGRTGRHVVAELGARGIAARALVRDPAKAAWMRDHGVEPVAGDLDRPETYAAHLQGIERVLLLAPNSPDQVRVECAFIDAAKAAGVRLLVKYSAVDAGVDRDYRFARWHGEIERHLRASGLAWAIVRPVFFMQNFFLMAESVRTEGRFHLPECEEPISLIDTRDAAAVSVTCLLDPRQEGCLRTLSGSDCLTLHEAAEHMSAVLGRRIEYVPLAPVQFRTALLGSGAPEWFVDGLIEFFDGARRGARDLLTTAVQRLLGREPVTFEQFLRDHAETFGG